MSTSDRWRLKRLVDVAIALPLTVLALPVVALSALVLAAQLRGWPFFVQERIGRGGTRMRLLKLRTLSVETPVDADKTTTVLEPVSRLADRLRRLHLDELPQLLLVLTGSMTLVGPRPLMPGEAAAADPAYLELRQGAPQGCTGLWQVGAGQHLRVTDSPDYDIWYVGHRGLRLDLWILYRTLRQSLGGRPVELGEIPRRLARPTEARPWLSDGHDASAPAESGVAA